MPFDCLHVAGALTVMDIAQVLERSHKTVMRKMLKHFASRGATTIDALSDFGITVVKRKSGRDIDDFILDETAVLTFCNALPKEHAYRLLSLIGQPYAGDESALPTSLRYKLVLLEKKEKLLQFRCFRNDKLPKKYSDSTVYVSPPLHHAKRLLAKMLKHFQLRMLKKTDYADLYDVAVEDAMMFIERHWLTYRITHLVLEREARDEIKQASTSATDDDFLDGEVAIEDLL